MKTFWQSVAYKIEQHHVAAISMWHAVWQRVATNLVPLLLELSIFEDLGHKQGSMQGWVGVHGTSNGLHQHNLSAATQDQDFHPMAGPSNKKQP